MSHNYPWPARNDPCPCRSGKKFKKCCDGSIRIDDSKIRELVRHEPKVVRDLIESLEAELGARGVGLWP